MSFFRPHAESEFPSCRIVVIGSAAADLEFIVNTLQDAGYESVTVVNDFSVDGFDHSTPQLHHRHPDLIILDLPAQDERELAQLTRLNTAGPTREAIPVLALVTDRPEHRTSVLEHGADDILVRPLIVEELLARTSILLRTKVLHQHGQQLTRQLDQARQLGSSTEVEYLRAVVDGMQECVLACDADGQPVFTNAAAARLGLDLLGAEQGPRLTPNLLRSPQGAPLSGDDDPLRRAWHGRTVIDQEVTINDPRHGRRVLVANANQIVADPGTRLGAVAVLHDVTENHRVMRALRSQVLHDGLTGLPNRVLFLDRLERAVAKAQRDHRPVAVMMLDVRPSSPAGDDLDNTARETVLITLARRLMMTLRPGDTSARLGDGFGILAAAPVGEGNARLIADRLRGELCHPVTIDGPPVTPELHIGIAISRDAEVPAEQLLQDAQAAALEAGRLGGNRYQLVECAPRQSFLEQHDLVADLRNAIPDGELGVHYQSMIDLVGGHVVGVEALARWNRPGQPPIAPARFIPLAAQNGFLATIDSWVLTTACHQLTGWQQADLIGHRFVMSVNISAEELAMPGWADQLGRIVQETDLDPHQIILEVSACALAPDPSPAIGPLHALRSHGVRLALDDVGNTRSSLAHLRQLPVEMIKLDQGLVSTLAEDQSSATAISQIIDLGHSLGMVVVAKGVETADQASALVILGCDLAQGHYFAQPLPAERMTVLLKPAPRTHLAAASHH